MQKGPSSTRAETTHFKTTPYRYSVTPGNQENLKRKQLTNIDLRTIQQHFLRHFTNNIFF